MSSPIQVLSFKQNFLNLNVLLLLRICSRQDFTLYTKLRSALWPLSQVLLFILVHTPKSKLLTSKIILNVIFGSMEEHHHSCDCLVSSCLLGPMDCLLNHSKCPRQYIFRFINLTNLY